MSYSKYAKVKVYYGQNGGFFDNLIQCLRRKQLKNNDI